MRSLALQPTDLAVGECTWASDEGKPRLQGLTELSLDVCEIKNARPLHGGASSERQLLNWFGALSEPESYETLQNVAQNVSSVGIRSSNCIIFAGSPLLSASTAGCTGAR